jgi:predicted nucleic acid binding AN1-type Zn finger protein
MSSGGMSNPTVQSILKSLTPILEKPTPKDVPALLDLDSGSISTTTNLKRCATCRKKLTLTDLSCGKCQSRFCSTHRLPEDHACSHNYRQEKVKLERVVADKLERI